ncbi:hypothetical protein EH165_08095 [Nakamurella antarctica]|uniref:MinD-like ATPase involved in chromosome partitioning or flagellar assembly n=1 Tax=Nakamurella antarctica TaxID=1902245 RepID=A0A3G8ZVR5_9ACTN|nr:hypothetical protein [Nakamurella antarctica]AZI58106.1 hypothetical protein EH165_08095 [Nakamurella antarctica]
MILGRSSTAKAQLIDAIVSGWSGPRQATVIGPKGGSSKTTVLGLLALYLAQYRADTVAAVDANTDIGTLSMRLGAPDLKGTRRLVDLMACANDITSLTDLAPFLQVVGRVRVLSNAGITAEAMGKMSEDDYRAVLIVLSRYLDLVLTDNGTSVTGPISTASLASAHALVLAAEMSVDSLNLVQPAVDALYRSGHTDLVGNAVMVISVKSAKINPKAFEEGVEHYRRQVRKVIIVPFDPHLGKDGRLSIDLLKPATQHAYLEAAAELAGSFGSSPRIEGWQP